MEPSEDAWIARHPALCHSLWWQRQLERQYARAAKAATAELKSTHQTIARMMVMAAAREKGIKQFSLFPNQTRPKLRRAA